MKIKFLISAICCLFFITQSIAQQKQNVYFLKNSGAKVDKVEDADVIRVVSEPDSGSTLYNVAEYYKNKIPKLSGKSSQVDPQVYEGLCITYYPTGKKQEVVNYKGGNRDGDAYQYYTNGKIYLHKKYIPGHETLIIDCVDSIGKALVTDSNGYYLGFDDDFKYVTEEGQIKDGLKNGQWKGDVKRGETKLTFNEDYDAGKLISGKSVDENGVIYTYTQRMVQPTFKGGLAAFGRYLADGIRYPSWAKINHKEGKVVATFVVQDDGSLGDYKIKENPDDQMSAEAIRILKISPKWSPGVFYGKIVPVSYTVPVNFKL
jgi:hypothetical protein